MRNIGILTVAQALSSCGTMLLATFGGIIGTTLAPSAAISTLPLSLGVLGVALGAFPAALLMRRIGRKAAFVGSAGLATAAALLCAVSVAQGSFAGLCVAGFLLGANMAFVQQYRFAAAEYVTAAQAGRAVSTVMLGTLVAAVIAPELGERTRLLGGWPEFTGSFVALAVVFALAGVVLLALGRPATRATVTMRPTRSLGEVARQPAFVASALAGATAYAVMSFIMTATPISMHVVDGLSVGATKSVISMHLLAMYVPSLMSGWLIRVAGVRRLMLAGLASMAACVAISLWLGQHVVHYAAALVLLGIGWNFLFVAGTTLLTTSYAPAERFHAQGLNDVVVFGSQATASLLAGPAITRLGWQAVNGLSVPFLVLMAAAVVWLGAQERAVARGSTAAVAP